MTTLTEYLDAEKLTELTTEEQFAISSTKGDAPEPTLEWFPDVKKWNIESLEREMGWGIPRLASAWSVKAVGRIYRRLAQMQSSHDPSLRMLINLANEEFHFDNWRSEVVDGSESLTKMIEVDQGKYNVEFECIVKVSLDDYTYIEQKGTGIAKKLPKSMAFSKSHKESYTDGLKKCLMLLCNMYEDYWEKVKTGEYKRYNGT